MSPTETPVLVDAHGHPLRTATSDRCPQCGEHKDKRVASSGFGPAHPVCGRCGYEWTGEVWRA